MRSALEQSRRSLAKDNRVELQIMTNLANTIQRERKYAQATELLTGLLQTRRRVNGPEHPTTVGARHNLAYNYLNLEQYAKAEELFLQVIEIQGRVRGWTIPV